MHHFCFVDPPELFLRKGVLKICINFTGEHLCRSVISLKLQSNFIEIALRHKHSPVNLLHIFRATFLKNTRGWLLVKFPPYFVVFYLHTLNPTLNIRKQFKWKISFKPLALPKEMLWRPFGFRSFLGIVELTEKHLILLAVDNSQEKLRMILHFQLWWNNSDK